MRAWLLQLVLCWLLAHMHVSDAATTHKKRATDCGAGQFQCKSGSCIPSSTVCNGNHDCDDGSDEAHALCDGDRPCVYPPKIENGEYIVLGCESCTPDPGKPIQVDATILRYTCNPGYTLKDGSMNILFCHNGQWNPNAPTCIQSHMHVSDAATTHKKRPTDCGDGQFQCKSGPCIPSSSVCNRKLDCDDGSDEERALCDGDGPCVYPSKIENGEYMVLGCESCTPDPGKPLQDGATNLQYICNPGYKLKDGSTSILFCHNGQWNSNPPTCEQLKCPRLTSESIVAECSHGQSMFYCDWPVEPGTKAFVECRTFYESASPEQSLTCGLDGQWNNGVMKCTPVCGKEQRAIIPLLAAGFARIVEEGEFPWHVGIYKNIDAVYEYFCGGSLISLRYVLSAAHCFWDNAKNEKYPVDLYKVVAGKYHRSYTTIDYDQEERTITYIDITLFFNGQDTFFREDIAVLTMDKPFQIGLNRRPVCVDWDGLYEIGAGDVGHASGWGLTEAGKLSEKLRSAVLPVIDTEKCFKDIKRNYLNYFGRDKICAGYRNGTTVCSGDSGGGLFFLQELNTTGRSNKAFFVHGIVSTSGGIAQSGSCNLDDYVAFTKVSSFRNFLGKYRES